MSFDLAVWSSDFSQAERKAAYIYDTLSKGGMPAELAANPNVAAFYEDLTTLWPEIESSSKMRIDDADKDLCPWSAAISHSDRHVLFSCEGSKAEEVYVLTRELARTHGLVFFDPQSEEVSLPE